MRPKIKLGFNLRIGRYSWDINIPSDRGDCGYFPHWTIDYHKPDPYTVSKHIQYVLKWFWLTERRVNPGQGSFMIGGVTNKKSVVTPEEKKRLRKFN